MKPIKSFLKVFALTLIILLSKTARAELLWDQWYTVKLSTGEPYGYYQDKIEIKDGKIFAQNHYYKEKEDEDLGSISNKSTLEPSFFSFSRVGTQKLPLKIEAQVTTNLLATIKSKQGENALQPIQVQLPKTSILSGVFPVWIGQILAQKTIKKGPIPFKSILEDASEPNFNAIDGQIQILQSDTFSKTTQTQRISVKFGPSESTWYVQKNGMPIKIIGEHIVEKATEQKAKSFLKEALTK